MAAKKKRATKRGKKPAAAKRQKGRKKALARKPTRLVHPKKKTEEDAFTVPAANVPYLQIEMPGDDEGGFFGDDAPPGDEDFQPK